MDRIFLSIGAMKAGTTWLHQQLAGHKDIYFCPEKEVHYFADPQAKTYMSLEGRVNRYQQVVRNLKAPRINPHVQRNLAWYGERYLAPQVNDEWYLSLFTAPPPAKVGAKYAADFSNLYADLNVAGWDHIRATFSTVRAIYTMRHPAKRLWSHFKFHHEHSGNNEHLNHITEQSVHSFFKNSNALIYADYAGTVERLRSILDETQIQFYFFEDFRTKPLESLSTIETFLGIAPGNYNKERFTKQINPSKSLSAPVVFKNAIEDFCADQQTRLQQLGFTLPQAWAKSLD